MKIALLVICAALVVWLPLRVKAGQTSQRVPSSHEEREELSFFGGGVPSGYMILGDTDVPPPGYTYSGVSFAVGAGTQDEPAWTTASPMINRRADVAAAAVNGKIYAIGGYNAGYLSSVEEYFPASNTWMVRSPMPTPRAEMDAVVSQGLIYVFGGMNGARLNTAEVYDPATDSWSTRSPMPTPRSLYASVSVGGKILILGGYNGGALVVAEEYDPISDSWATMPPLPGVNSEGAAAVFNGMVYVIGGDNGFQPNQSIMVYDPGTQTWSTRPGPPMYDHALAVLGDVLYSFGGIYGGTVSFDANVTAWTSLQDMPTPRSTLASAVIGHQAYLLGGLSGSPSSAVEVYSAPRRVYAHRKN